MKTSYLIMFVCTLVGLFYCLHMDDMMNSRINKLEAMVKHNEESDYDRFLNPNGNVWNTIDCASNILQQEIDNSSARLNENTKELMAGVDNRFKRCDQNTVFDENAIQQLIALVKEEVNDRIALDTRVTVLEAHQINVGTNIIPFDRIPPQFIPNMVPVLMPQNMWITNLNGQVCSNAIGL